MSPIRGQECIHKYCLPRDMSKVRRSHKSFSPILFRARLQLKIGDARLLIDDMPAKAARQIMQQKSGGTGSGRGGILQFMKTLNKRQNEMKPRHAHTHDSLPFVLHKIWTALDRSVLAWLVCMYGRFVRAYGQLGKAYSNERQTERRPSNN